MKSFEKEACKIVDMLEILANRIYGDEQLKEYFIEAYDYLDGDDAVPSVLYYIQDKFFH